MPAKTITNPNGAFGYTDLDQKFSQTTEEYKAAGAIAANTLVAIAEAGTVTQAAVGVAAPLVIGVADRALVSGETGQIIVGGIAENVLAQGAIAAGAIVTRSGVTAGAAAAQAAAQDPGSGIGVAISAAASNRVNLYIFKS